MMINDIVLTNLVVWFVVKSFTSLSNFYLIVRSGGYQMNKRKIMLSMNISWMAIYASSAFAQISPADAPPTVNLNDPTGVDLFSGQFNRKSGTISIGDVSAPSLSFDFLETSRAAYTATPYQGSIDSPMDTDHNCGDIELALDCNYYRVAKGFEVYQIRGGAYSARGDYLRELLDHIEVQENNGTIWRYARTPNTSYSGALQKIIYPDGRTLSYYFGGNFRSITSSDGYQLRINMNGVAPAKATLVNLAVDYCSPEQSTCAFTKAWPVVEMSFSSSGSTRNYIVKDAMQNNWSASTTTLTTASSVTTVSSPLSKTYSVWRDRFGLSSGFPGSIRVSKYQDYRGTWNYNYTFSHYGDQFTSTSTSPLQNKRVFTDPGDLGLANGHTFKDPNGNISTYKFYAGDGVTSAFHVDGPVGEIRSPSQKTQSVNYTRGSISSASINSADGTISVSNAIAVSCANFLTCNKPQYSLDARAGRTDYTYASAHGGVLTELLPANASGVRRRNVYTYEQHSAQLAQGAADPIWKLASKTYCTVAQSCAGSANEIIETYGYDRNLLLSSVTVKNGAGAVLSTKTNLYDDYGNLIEVDGPQPGSQDKIYLFYDMARHIVGQIGALSDHQNSASSRPAVRMRYNADGLVDRVDHGFVTGSTLALLNAMSPQSTEEIYYDGANQKEKSVTRGSAGTVVSITQYGYTAEGLLECTAVRMNPAAFSSLPSSACTLGPQGANGPDRITKNVYDAAGQLIQVRDGVATPLERATATYSYTVNGKQEYVIDANGNRAKLEYDGFDRQVKWIFPAASRPSAYNPSSQANALATAGSINTGDYEQYGYDANGNRTSLRKRSGKVINFTYDALNRMTLKNLPDTTTADVYYGYDLRGLQTYARFGSASGGGVTNAWDGLGRMTSSTNNMSGTTRTLGYQYDANGNRTRLTFPDQQYISYEYDGLDRMKLIKQGSSTVIGTMVYNDRGERDCWLSSSAGTCTTLDAGKTDYSYDSIGRLSGISHDVAGTTEDVTFCLGSLSGTTCTASYNPAGQVLVRTISNNSYIWNGHRNVDRSYTTNGRNQYTGAGGASFTYDTNGNLRSDGTRTYTYDVENRLISATGAPNVTLSYDPLGRLYETAGSATTRFLYDGDALVGEYNGAGTLLRRYVHGPNTDEPLFWYEGADLSALRVLRTDHQGSIVSISNASGTSVDINSYDEYGMPEMVNDGNGLPVLAHSGRFAYTGQIIIPEIGMYHYKARIYSPTLGRFLQTDPVGYEDQINLYAYVGNDPVNVIDPTGKDSYVVARAVARAPFANHAFVVINAKYLGDPNAVVITFGHGKAGTVANISDDRNAAVSNLHTNKVDRDAWLSLAREHSDASYVKIDAPDSIVTNSASQFDSSSTTYYFLGPNSTSAAFAVADRAVQEASGDADRRVSRDGLGLIPGSDAASTGAIEFKDGNNPRECTTYIVPSGPGVNPTSRCF